MKSLDRVTENFHYYKDSLNDKIWTSEDTLRPRIRKALMRIAEDFMDSLDIKVKIEDITFTGSLANYNYSPQSDIDLHVIVNFDKFKKHKDLAKGYFDKSRRIWNNKHKITVKGYEVEVYVQDESEPHHSSGVYSIEKNDWIVVPLKISPNFDVDVVQKKASDLMKRIDDALAEDASLSILSRLKDKIVKMRSEGLEKEGETSTENLVFKVLRRKGYLQKLMEAINIKYDQSMTVEERVVS